MVNLLMKDLQALCIKHNIDIIDVEGAIVRDGSRLFDELAIVDGEVVVVIECKKEEEK